MAEAPGTKGRFGNTGRFGPITVGGFEIQSVLGQGGMGRVYKARQPKLDRVVALKVLDPQVALDPIAVERFLREARSAGKLRHQNVVALHDVGTCSESKLHYLAMEYVDGGTLEAALVEGGLSERRAWQVCHGVAQALVCAEEKGLIHRDVKPENILLTAAGQPKLADLGLAKRQDSNSLTNAGVVLGSAHYVAPEQALGEPDLDIRADIYSLGITLFRCVTGKPPYEGGSFYELAEQHIACSVPDPRDFDPELSEATSRLIAGMCARERADRYPSAQALVADLERALAGQELRGAKGDPGGDTLRRIPKPQDRLQEPARTRPFEVLIVVEGRVLARQVVDQDKVVIGRSNACDVVVDSPVVSRRHAEVRRDGMTLSVSPLSNTNRTTLGLDALDRTVLLGPGDVVTLSDEVEVHVEFVAEPRGREEEQTEPVVQAASARKGPASSEGQPELHYERDGRPARLGLRRSAQVGGSSLCDVRLGPGTPRKAALIVRVGGSWVLWNVAEDPSAVKVGGEPLSDQARLVDGDTIEVCGLELTFRFRG